MADERLDEPLLSVRDVARLYGVDEATIYAWVRKRAIGYVLVGPFRLIRIRESDAKKGMTRVPGADDPPEQS